MNVCNICDFCALNIPIIINEPIYCIHNFNVLKYISNNKLKEIKESTKIKLTINKKS
jgi:hypothetical protein